MAGQFYAGTKNELQNQIKECFLDKRGVGKLPEIKKQKSKIFGAIAPHAGFVYSGAIASHSYNEIAENGFSDTFIILGPNHTGYGSGVSAMKEGYWTTPLGEIKINSELGDFIIKDIIDENEKSHVYEHSIEVQLPFLQFISNKKEFDIVPICMMMQDFETSFEVGNIIADAIKSYNKSVKIIASTDFSHVGFNYRTMPPSGIRVDDYAKKQDEQAIEKIIKLDPEGLIKTVNDKNISMCGYGPVAAMIVALKKLGATKSKLLKYGTSYEVYPNSSTVGYGSIIVY